MDDVKLIGNAVRTERNSNVLLNAFEDIGLSVNIGETKYAEVVSHRRMAEKSKLSN